MEEYKPIEGFPGYLISNRGRVYSIKNKRHITTPPQPVCEGHNNPNKFLVKLYNKGKRHSTMVHTLVGRHFLPDYQEGLLILHKDETLPFPEINYVDNLWVGTQSDNRKDCLRKGRDNQTRDALGRFS